MTKVIDNDWCIVYKDTKKSSLHVKNGIVIVTRDMVSTIPNGISVQEIYFSETVKKIGYKALKNQHGLVKVEVPSVNSIESRAFENCVNLKHLFVGPSLVHLGHTVFKRCPLDGVIIWLTKNVFLVDTLVSPITPSIIIHPQTIQYSDDVYNAFLSLNKINDQDFTYKFPNSDRYKDVIELGLNNEMSYPPWLIHGHNLHFTGNKFIDDSYTLDKIWEMNLKKNKLPAMSLPYTNDELESITTFKMEIRRNAICNGPSLIPKELQDIITSFDSKYKNLNMKRYSISYPNIQQTHSIFI